MFWNNLVKKYDKNTVDLIIKIEKYVQTRFENHSFSGQYAEGAFFAMTEIENVGAFVVKFKDAPFVAVAGINMIDGDYYFESTAFGDQVLNIYSLDGLDIKRLVDRAESEWAIEADFGKMET